jgi:Ser/Thr protein kinase RdoA (MazF antagonist)
LRRLRELAETALNAYGVKKAGLRFLQYGENAIYRVDLPRSRARTVNSPYLPNRYVLRLHAMQDADAIASELTWLAALNQEAGLPVPAPVATPDGKLLATIVTPGMPQGRVVSLMRWLDGRKIQKGLHPHHLTALGQMVAQLHEFAAGWQPPAGFSRFVWDWNSQLGGSMFKHSREELVASMPSKYKEPFEIVSQKIKRVMKSLGKESDAFGMIHADLYPENFLFKDGKAYPIDFEDCGFGYWVWDIAIALCKWAWNEEWDRMRDAFHEGYSQVRTLPDKQWKQLDLFVATQFATMVLWESEFIKNDPRRQAEYAAWRIKNGDNLLRYFERGGN